MHPITHYFMTKLGVSLAHNFLYGFNGHSYTYIKIKQSYAKGQLSSFIVNTWV